MENKSTSWCDEISVTYYISSRSLLQKLIGQDGYWQVDFHQHNAQGKFFKPERKDISMIEDEQIVTLLAAPTSAGKTERILGSLSFIGIPNGIDIR